MTTGMPFRTKICGHTRDRDVAASVEAGVDAIGVITAVPVETPRAVEPESAVRLVNRVADGTLSVLVTMPGSPMEAIDLVDRIAPDVLQIHGPMEDSAFGSIVANVDVPVIKSVTTDDDSRTVHRFADRADALLLDSRSGSGAGGTGRTNDWERARAIVSAVDCPVILAGGLTPENVRSAIETVRPAGVDVASGVELRGGVKDHGAVDRFVRAAIRELEAVNSCS